MNIRKSIIAAIGKNRELGAKNALLWEIPEDMQYFRDMTRGKPVIMGLNTFRSIGRALPGRPNIVLTKNKHAADVADIAVLANVTLAESLPEAYKIAGLKAVELGVDEVFNIGGGSVYAQGLLDSDKLYLTLVDSAFPNADIFFPAYEHVFKKKVSSRASGTNDVYYEFVTLEK
jgi:dihydrofolate reductase